jgi:hypothetical protein
MRTILADCRFLSSCQVTAGAAPDLAAKRLFLNVEPHLPFFVPGEAEWGTR